MALGFYMGKNTGETYNPPIGQIWNYIYTGGISTLTIPADGIYKLTVGGGYSYVTSSIGRVGGLSVGYKKLKKGTKLYICCGGGSYLKADGGYNGGGVGKWTVVQNSGGGGATHIALVNGTLKDIGSSNLNEILIVAGGAGGSSYNTAQGNTYYGCAGGGTNGASAYNATGGTQVSGYSFGQGQGGSSFGSYGSGGGGGGLYGGYISSSGNGGHGQGVGGGGSGYIGGVPSFVFNGVTYSPTTTQGGASSGNGYAKIECVA